MATMTEQQRAEIWAEWMRTTSAERSGIGSISKAELRAAFDAADDWVDANQSSYVSALSTNASAFNAAATASQKARLLQFVLRKRYQTGT